MKQSGKKYEDNGQLLSSKVSSNTFGKQTYNQTYDTSKFSILNDSLHKVLKFEFLFREIYEKIQFFDKPDIIPYPSEDLAKSIRFEDNIFDHAGGTSKAHSGLQSSQSSNRLQIDSNKLKQIDSSTSSKQNSKRNPNLLDPDSNFEDAKSKSSKKSSNSRKSTPFSAKSKSSKNMNSIRSKLSKGSQENEDENKWSTNKNQNRAKEKLNTEESRKSKNKAEKLREKSNKSRGSSKSRESRGHSHSKERPPNSCFETTEIGCDTCIRLHRHEWAIPPFHRSRS